MDISSALKSSIDEITTKLGFALEEKQEYFKCFDSVLNNPLWWEKLTTAYQNYKNDINTNIIGVFKEIGAQYENNGGKAYTLYMTALLCFANALRQHYIDSGIDETYYDTTIADLKYKNDECVLVKGVAGTFVPDWYANIYKIECVGFGRLQFELFSLPFEFDIDGQHFEKGTKTINVHIPRTGTRLDHSEVEKSYKMAAKYFEAEFKGSKMIFTCGSWMLFPWIETVLSPDSNMIKFYKDFKIIASGFYEDYSQVWRLFDCEYEGDPDKLPYDSSLRRAFVDRIKSGDKIGWGRGVFIYK